MHARTPRGMDNMEESEGKQVCGTVLSFNRGAGFLKFNLHGKENICLFRPNRLFIDGQKVPASKIKTIDGVSKVLISPGD